MGLRVTFELGEVKRGLDIPVINFTPKTNFEEYKKLVEFMVINTIEYMFAEEAMRKNEVQD